MRRRLAAAVHPLPPLALPPPHAPPHASTEPDSEPDSSCSESGPSTAFRPTDSEPGPSSGGQQQQGDYPSPNISVGPPMQAPAPHLLPYPHGHLGLHTLYPHPHLAPPPPHPPPPHPPPHGPPPPPLSSLFSQPHLTLFNAQLALAAHAAHPAFFGHYASLTPQPHPHTHPHSIKGSHRFAPYSLPSAPSAFETVAPAAATPNTPPPPLQPPPPNTSPPPPSPSPSATTPVPQPASTASELKSIEKMVNGLEVDRTADSTDK